jgi:DNA-directed RNA polymerase specialized sigma24 family protein
MAGAGKNVMTKEKLKQLRWLRREIDDIKGRIADIGGRETPVVKDRVKSSGREWPYIEGHSTIQGFDEKAGLRRSMDVERLSRTLEKRQEEADGLRAELEEYIGTIDDSRIRLMMEYRYIDGYSSRRVGELMNCDRSTVEKAISKYIREHP